MGGTGGTADMILTGGLLLTCWIVEPPLNATVSKAVHSFAVSVAQIKLYRREIRFTTVRFMTLKPCDIHVLS